MPRLVLLCVWFVALLAASAAHARPQPNLILITADDLGYGEIGVYGGREIPTPNIDALARSGALLTDGYASAAQCSPSRAGLLTGRYQQRFGHHNNPPPSTHPAFQRFGLPVTEITIADELKRRGYATGVVGKWHLGFKPQFFPLRRGFDEFFGYLEGDHDYFADQPWNPIYRNNRIVRERQYLTRALARESVAFIRRHAAEPFFLYAAFGATHLPLQAEPAMLARFSHIADPKRRTFAAMLAHLDEAVGSIVGAVRAAGLARDTLIVFTTDNGCVTVKSTCRNKPLRSGKGMLYEGGIRVPFVVSWPGTIPAGRRLGEPVTQRDLFPTFLSAATGAPYANARLDGVNLLPLLRGATASLPSRSLFWGTGGAGAVRRGEWKLYEVPAGSPQLFNLRADIGERNDLASSHPDLVAELRRERIAWGRTLVAPLWPVK